MLLFPCYSPFNNFLSPYLHIYFDIDIWPDEVLEEAPFDFKIEPALRIIGYNTKNLSAAITAFKLHYIQTDTSSILDRKTIDTIYSIYKKQLQ